MPGRTNAATSEPRTEMVPGRGRWPRRWVHWCSMSRRTSRAELFTSYQRSEQALLLSLMEMVIHGVSTRKISEVTSGYALNCNSYETNQISFSRSASQHCARRTAVLVQLWGQLVTACGICMLGHQRLPDKEPRLDSRLRGNDRQNAFCRHREGGDRCQRYLPPAWGARMDTRKMSFASTMAVNRTATRATLRERHRSRR